MNDESENQTTRPPHPPDSHDSELPTDTGISPKLSRWSRMRAGLRRRMTSGTSSVKQGLSADNLKKVIGNFDLQASLERTSSFIQKRGTDFYGLLLTILLSTFFISDLTALLVEELIPQPVPFRGLPNEGAFAQAKSIQDYNAIFSRNLFNSLGIIPGEEVGSPAGNDGPPVKTGLPLNLIGTLIMTDELRSLATLEDKGTSQVFPVQVDDEIPGKLRVQKIEPTRVIFLNFSTNRREYVELPEDTNVTNPRLTPGKSTGPSVEQVNPSQFNVSRSEIDKTLSDLNNVLTQARAVPNFEAGSPAGYKLLQIVPGSIYDKLGLKNGDVIYGLNGQIINDPGKAFEMLSELKTSNHLELQIKKDGKMMNYRYDIR